jgi:quercetin dioxygenase-like cupin family protein
MHFCPAREQSWCSRGPAAREKSLAGEQPGTHRFPVTVYVLEGTFTLELDGRAPIVVKAGEALVEPPRVAMTGYNRSSSEPTRVVIFYVSDPDTPFLDAHH